MVNAIASTRVVIIDDHAVVRSGVRFVLESEADITVVGEAASATEGLKLLRQTEPDIAIVDVSLPDLGGIELTRRIRREFPGTGVIVFTFHEGDEYFFKALQAGASGYLVKGSPSEELIDVIRAVRGGGTYLEPSEAARLVKAYVEDRNANALEGLSPREREVAQAMIDGLSNQEIASKLFIGVTTVQTHRAHIMEKLNLRSYADLIRYAIRKGIIEP